MSCRPPTNSTYLVVGQDLFSINEYVTSQYNYSLHGGLHQQSNANGTWNEAGNDVRSISSFVPSAFMVYTDLATLGGLWEPTDYGSGVEYADGALDLFPSPSTGLQIGLWLDGIEGCASVNAGEMDRQISLLAAYLERCRASRIFLRLGYEFDNPSFGYSDDPAMYVLAFRKIVADCRERLSEGARGRVLFVWHSWAAPMANASLSLDQFYPGDEYVDWIGVSIFQQVFPWSPYWGGTIQDVERVLEFALKHDKPTMIAESTPFGGIELKQASKDAAFYLANNEYDHDDWARWFGKVIDVIDRYDVSMWCYINCDWESQPMWHGVGFGETRLSTNPTVMSHWHEQVVENGAGSGRKFLSSGSLESCGAPGKVGLRETKNKTAGRGVFASSNYFCFFILVPFLVASGAFFVPYFISGARRSRRGGSSDGERRPLLSDTPARDSPAPGSLRGGEREEAEGEQEEEEEDEEKAEGAVAEPPREEGGPAERAKKRREEELKKTMETREKAEEEAARRAKERREEEMRRMMTAKAKGAIAQPPREEEDPAERAKKRREEELKKTMEARAKAEEELARRAKERREEEMRQMMKARSLSLKKPFS